MSYLKKGLSFYFFLDEFGFSMVSIWRIYSQMSLENFFLLIHLRECCVLCNEHWIFTLMITWGSNNYFVTFPVSLVSLVSFVQKEYNFTIFSNNNEKLKFWKFDWLSLVSMFKKNIISIFSQIIMKSWNFGNLTDSKNYFVKFYVSLVSLVSFVQKEYNFTIFSNNNEKLKFWKFDWF